MKTESTEPEVPDVEPSDTDSQSETLVLSSLEQQHYEEIKRAEDDAKEAEEIYLDAKSEAKAAKEVWERSVERLRSLIRSGPGQQQRLPFVDDDPEEWRAVPIGDILNLTEKQAEKLEAAGVKTIGQFEELRAGQVDGYPDGLLSLDRVGQATVDQWEEQVVDWLAVNAREVPDEDEADDAEQEGDE